jgi:inosine-uridine nucleoside N-ribohydrolase
VATFGTARSRFFIESNDLRRTFEKAHRGLTGSSNPDPMTVAIAINPAIATKYVSMYMQVELEGALTRGLLVYGDNIYRGEAIPPPNVDMCVAASNAEFKKLVYATLSRA